VYKKTWRQLNICIPVLKTKAESQEKINPGSFFIDLTGRFSVQRLGGALNL
jgi:hypothetical protein